jgi:tRNA 2-thiocytidine biosynthesis protein TtcA
MADLVPIHRLQQCRVERAAPHPRVGGARSDEPSKLSRLLLRKVGQAIADFPMIGEGDRVMVCVSGGKDSYALLDLLLLLQRRAPVGFELLAVNIDQGWPGYRTDLIAAHLAERGVPHRMVADDFASVVEANVPAGKTPCSLCSRLRRGLLYNLAVELGCQKIALGHHMDDLIETLVLNLFYSGKLASMPAVLRSDDGRNTVIRPLAYVPESMLVEYAAERAFPLVSCGCPACGLPEQKRQVVKQLLARLEESDPGIKQNMLAALRNVRTSHLLDPALATPNLQTMQQPSAKERSSGAF